MRVARHHGVRVRGRQLHQRTLYGIDSFEEPIDLAAQVKPQVGGDLVVARARGVQALAGFARELGQPRLHIQVHILERHLPLEGPGLDFSQNLLQALHDARQVLGAQNTRRRQHRGMRERSLDVGTRKPLVEADARRVVQHELGDWLGKPPGPRALLGMQGRIFERARRLGGLAVCHFGAGYARL